MSAPHRGPGGPYAMHPHNSSSGNQPAASGTHHYAQWANPVAQPGAYRVPSGSGMTNGYHRGSQMTGAPAAASQYAPTTSGSSMHRPYARGDEGSPTSAYGRTMGQQHPDYMSQPHRAFERSPASKDLQTTEGFGSAKKRKAAVQTLEADDADDEDDEDVAASTSRPYLHDAAELSPGSGQPQGEGGPAHKSDAPKRIKTARACDSCRRKKIRCDVVDDGSPPPGDPNNGNGGLTCAHCRQYGFSCTFFLPITETRFKKKREREAEEAAARNAAAVGHFPLGASLAPLGSAMRPGSFGGLSPSVPPPPPASVSAAQEWPPPRSVLRRFQDKWGSDNVAADGSHLSPKSTSLPPMSSGLDVGPVNGHSTGPSAGGGGTPPSEAGPPPDSRVMGPTSLAYIVHSTAFIPGSAIEAHDLRHSQTFEVGASGDGIIKLNRPRQREALSASEAEDEDASSPRIPDAIRGRLAGDVAEKLINTYFEKLGYLHPIVTKSEFLHLTRPPPLLFYAICGAAALDRSVPKEVLSAIRIGLNAIFRDGDILSVSSASTVKALLILSLHADVHGSSNVQSGSRMWNRLGVALRMAQDLGLHRDASGRDDVDEFAHFLEQKRRIWGACVTADRLVSIATGHPLTVDLTDCDVRLPSPYEVLRFPTDLSSLPGEERPFAFNTEMLKLSILFGRVQKTIYSPTGLMKATDEEITGLLRDIDQWREALPDLLRFTGPNSSPSAGILQLAFSCIQMLFFRVFMRISYSCPQHLKFSLTIERMTDLIRWSRESIDWMEASGAFYLDTLQFVSYALVFCATVQYHSWVRRGDEEGLKALTKLKQIVSQGLSHGTDERKPDLSLRAKTAEIIGLLHEAASGRWANTPSTGNLNPTAGVVNRRTADSVKGIIWRNAPGRPGGGSYEASEPHLLLSDLPPGTIILDAKRAPALVRSANGWQQVPGVLPEQNLPPTNGSGADSGLPDLSNFTHLGGSVWQDASGWPVDRRGSGLMVVLPQGMQGGQQQQQQQNGMVGFGSMAQLPNGADGSAQHMNVNPHLNNLDLTGALTDGTGGNMANRGSSGQQPNIQPLPTGGAMITMSSAANGANGGASNNGVGGGLESLFNLGSDPMMLNDPLMGMLDWQAWQTYLGPTTMSGGGANGGAGPDGHANPAGNGNGNGNGNVTPSGMPAATAVSNLGDSQEQGQSEAVSGPQSRQQQAPGVISGFG